MSNIYIATYTGKKFHILSDDPDEIDIRDIAHATSQICRFNGHIDTVFSVMDHQILVMWLVETMGGTDMEIFEGLLHDAAEAYIADMAKPWKELLPDYNKLEARVDKRIRAKFGLPEEHSSIVKRADITALFLEAERCLSAVNLHEWQGYAEFLQDKPEISLIWHTEEQYLHYFYSLQERSEK